MQTEEIVQRLTQAAITFVSYRPRSRREISVFLDKHLKKSGGENASTIRESVLTRMDELGYIDDLKFALLWVSSRNGRKPKGERLVRQELRAKGIDEETVDTALRTGREEADLDNEHGDPEFALALRAAEKKDKVYSKLPVPERKNKLFAFLMRQGFSPDVTGRVIDEVIPKNYNMRHGDQE